MSDHFAARFRKIGASYYVDDANRVHIHRVSAGRWVVKVDGKPVAPEEEFKIARWRAIDQLWLVEHPK